MFDDLVAGDELHKEGAVQTPITAIVDILILSDEIERLNASYIAGEIDSDALTATILRSETVQPQ